VRNPSRDTVKREGGRETDIIPGVDVGTSSDEKRNSTQVAMEAGEVERCVASLEQRVTNKKGGTPYIISHELSAVIQEKRHNLNGARATG
jgi:hypothetical protein